MFVDIENPKSPLKIANILTAYDKGLVIKGVRQSPQKLTPEVCFDILKSTNYPRCIRDILQLIAKLPDEEQAQFKDVVLACFDNEKSSYGIDFAKAQKIKDGPYLFSEVDAQKCEARVDAVFTDEDFRTYDKVVFLSDKKIQFGINVKFPKNMDIPNASDVCFYDEQEALGVNLEGAQNIHLKDGAKLVLKGAVNVPVGMDFSQCDEVDLDYCDLSEQENLCFKDGAKVSLSGTENLHGNLDVSPCAEVDLAECDLSSVKKLVFKSRQQMEDSHVELPDGWSGKLVFADEQQQTPSLGLVMGSKAKGGR